MENINPKPAITMGNNIGAIPVEHHNELIKLTHNLNLRMATEFRNSEDLKRVISDVIHRRFAKEPFIEIFIV